MNALAHIQATLLKDPSVSVNRVAWSPEGCLFGKFLKIMEDNTLSFRICLFITLSLFLLF